MTFFACAFFAWHFLHRHFLHARETMFCRARHILHAAHVIFCNAGHILHIIITLHIMFCNALGIFLQRKSKFFRGCFLHGMILHGMILHRHDFAGATCHVYPCTSYFACSACHVLQCATHILHIPRMSCFAVHDIFCMPLPPHITFCKRQPQLIYLHAKYALHCKTLKK